MLLINYKNYQVVKLIQPVQPFQKDGFNFNALALNLEGGNNENRLIYINTTEHIPYNLITKN